MRHIIIGIIPIDIPIAEVIITFYSEEVTTSKTPKVKFIKPSASSIPTMVPRTLQVREATPSLVPAKGRRILPSRSQSQSDLISEGVRSQVYSGRITRSKDKALTYAAVTLQSLSPPPAKVGIKLKNKIRLQVMPFVISELFSMKRSYPLSSHKVKLARMVKLRTCRS